MSDTEIVSWLNSHDDARLDVERVTTGTLRDWLEDMDASTRAGVRRAWLVGRVLNAERAGLPHGEVEEWEQSRARELHRKVRTIQLYRYVAEALEDPKIATGLRISHADEGLKALVQAIRRQRRKHGDQVPRPAADKAAVWQAQAERLLRNLPSTPDQVDLLQAHMDAVAARLLELRAASAPPAESRPTAPPPAPTVLSAPPTPPPPATPTVLSAPPTPPPTLLGNGLTLREAAKAHLDQLETGDRPSLLPAARWTMELLLADLSEEFLTRTLTDEHVRTFLRTHATARAPNRLTGTLMGYQDLHDSLLAAIAWWSTQDWCTNIRSLPVP